MDRNVECGSAKSLCSAVVSHGRPSTPRVLGIFGRHPPQYSPGVKRQCICCYPNRTHTDDWCASNLFWMRNEEVADIDKIAPSTVSAIDRRAQQADGIAALAQDAGGDPPRNVELGGVRVQTDCVAVASGARFSQQIAELRQAAAEGAASKGAPPVCSSSVLAGSVLRFLLGGIRGRDSRANPRGRLPFHHQVRLASAAMVPQLLSGAPATRTRSPRVCRTFLPRRS